MKPRVLVLRALGLGDFLTGVPAYRALRAAHPRHEVVLAAPAVLAPLAPLTGAIDRLLPTGELAPIPWSGPPPELGIDLHGNGPASHRLVEATGARRALMYDGVHGPPWRADEHEVHRWCRLLRWAGIAADPGDLQLSAPPGPPPVPRAVIVHPGAAAGSRRWPAARYAEVARALHERDHPVVLTGSAAERPLAEHVARLAGLGGDRVLAGRTGLAELAALVAAATLTVSGDTGLSHLATAFSTPSVTLFGPVSPALWGPPERAGRHVALWRGTSGRPGDPHGDRPDPRLLAISPAEVLDACESLLRQVGDLRG